MTGMTIHAEELLAIPALLLHAPRCWFLCHQSLVSELNVVIKTCFYLIADISGKSDVLILYKCVPGTTLPEGAVYLSVRRNLH
jgi:hypothetical protein